MALIEKGFEINGPCCREEESIWFDNLKKEDNIDTGTCWKLFILTEIDSDCVDLARRLNMGTNSNSSTT